MKTLQGKALTTALVVAVAVLGGLAGYLLLKKGTSPSPTTAATSPAGAKTTYSCPMHPSVVSDHPDKCPICHMDLQKVEDDGETQSAADDAQPPRKDRKILFYRHPMRPEITSPVPAKDEMGMDYTPVYEDEATTTEETTVPGRAAFRLSTERQQLIGVTTAKAERKRMSYEVRASGTAAFDPDLFTAIEEYRQALGSLQQMGANEMLRQQAEALVESSKTRLRLLGLSEGQIKRLGTSHVSPMSLILPKGHVWVYAEVFEYEIAGLKAGQEVEVTTPSAPGKTFAGKLGSISPVLNAQTRSVRIRALIPDPERILRPDSFVNVKIRVDLGELLTVPPDAVLHSGEEDFVFVVKTKGRFEPRAVKVGAKAKGGVEIVSGLSEGETVVTAANFLIDSESRLRGALQNMKAPQPSPSPVKGTE